MKIQAVIISVDYADYLAHTLPVNKPHFDDIVVVTTPADIATIEVCRANGVTCINTDAFYHNKNKFNKGRAINIGIAALESPEWIVLIDADVVLPKLTRSLLDKIHISEQHIYGIDRMNCPSYTAWQHFLSKAESQHENSFYIFPKPWKVETRVMSLEHGGYVPIGFFQLFNVNADSLIRKPYYPENHGNATFSDIEFALRWPRTHRHLLPEIIGIHLTTKDSHSGINWDGRQSSKFGE